MRKALTCLGVVASLAWLLTGCGSSEQKAEGPGRSGNKPPIKVGIVFDSGGRGDKSFNDSAWAGIERAVRELGVQEQAVESKSEKDYEANLTAVADRGCQLVFAIGINMKTALEKVAPNYPDTKFAIVDASVDLPNVRSLLFKEEEGSFLAGYLAGLVTRTKKIGFVGGMELDLIKKFFAGYAAGARTADPAVTILPAKYIGSWDNVDLAKTAAATLFGQGADIVYHAAGRAGQGVIDAAKQRGKYAIGVDSDQDALAPGFVLTSMIKRVDEAVFQTISDAVAGNFTAGSKVYDLKAKGVGLSPFTYTKDKIGSAVLQKVSEMEKRIAEGAIKVPASLDELRAYEAGLTAR
ncbi:MAG: BMP family ABC transporter substrate-binding protein [Fimbriimonadales bacterium]|nr:BMP family ABC transporter substrate-binding protein [Fimbriimonadales bacterium]